MRAFLSHEMNKIFKAIKIGNSNNIQIKHSTLQHTYTQRKVPVIT